MRAACGARLRMVDGVSCLVCVGRAAPHARPRGGGMGTGTQGSSDGNASGGAAVTRDSSASRAAVVVASGAAGRVAVG